MHVELRRALAKRHRRWGEFNEQRLQMMRDQLALARTHTRLYAKRIEAIGRAILGAGVDGAYRVRERAPWTIEDDS